MAEGRGEASHGGGREGKALCIGDGDASDVGGDPDPRRLRLHEGISRGALLPRREDHRNLRGHERDPAPRDRALDPRLDRALAGGPLSPLSRYTRARVPTRVGCATRRPLEATISARLVRLRANSAPISRSAW